MEEFDILSLSGAGNEELLEVGTISFRTMLSDIGSEPLSKIGAASLDGIGRALLFCSVAIF